MTSGADEQQPLSFEEYLRFEQLSDVRHEYVGGQVFAMTGGTVRHGQMSLFSDSTRDKDERDKSAAYTKLPSIRGYLLVETTSRTIQLRTPAEVGWHIRYYHDDDVLDLDGVQIKVGELYDRLDRLAPATSSLD